MHLLGGPELGNSTSPARWVVEFGTPEQRAQISLIRDRSVRLSAEPEASPWLPSFDTLRTYHRVPSPHVRSERRARASDSCICSVPCGSCPSAR